MIGRHPRNVEARDCWNTPHRFVRHDANRFCAAQVLDSMAGDLQGPALASLLCNRALCYQKMDLHRKALKVEISQPAWVPQPPRAGFEITC